MREIYQNENGRIICYRQVSQWLKIRYKHVTHNHSLYDYAKDNDNILVYFMYKNHPYALGQFMRFEFGGGRNVELDDLEGHVTLVGYDATSPYMPFLLEMHDDNYVRLWLTSEVTL